MTRSHKPSPRDCTGTLLPAYIANQFNAHRQIKMRLKNNVRGLERVIEALAESGAGHRLDAEAARNALHQWAANLKALMPFVLCPYCAADAVESTACACRGTGWLTESEYMLAQENDPRVRKWPTLRKPCPKNQAAATV